MSKIHYPSRLVHCGGVIGLCARSYNFFLKKSLADHFLFRVRRFVVAWLCTGVGATGMLWFWWRWRKNYLWALNQIFMYVEVLEKSV